MISLKQLRYFDAVVRLGHFGRAADDCAVSQPALSMQIQNLEAMLGTSLLERTSKGVIPTRTGRDVARRAAVILAQARDLADAARHSDGTLSGDLQLGVIPSIAPYLLPDFLPELRARHPAMNLHVRESLTAQLLEELEQGQLDLLIIALPFEPMPGEVQVLPLFDDRFLLAMPYGMKPSGRMLAPLELIRNGDMLLLEEGHCMRDQTLAWCNLQQAGLLNSKGATSLATLVQMVAGGLGVTLLPEMGAKIEAQNRHIVIREFDDPQPSRQIVLAWRATSPRQQDFHAVARVILDTRQR